MEDDDELQNKMENIRNYILLKRANEVIMTI